MDNANLKGFVGRVERVRVEMRRASQKSFTMALTAFALSFACGLAAYQAAQSWRLRTALLSVAALLLAASLECRKKCSALYQYDKRLNNVLIKFGLALKPASSQLIMIST